MGFIKRGKKAELTSSQIITIVLAIAGFIIVLIFLAILFEDKGGGDRELCKFSVLTRATSPIESLQASIPLKCTTEKICISESGKKDACKQFAGEENKKPVELKGTVDEKARKIEETAANAMFDCWSMMGEGKLNVFSGSEFGGGVVSSSLDVFTDVFGFTESIKSTCVICSRVALADDLFEEDGKPGEVLKRVDINRYLKDEFIPNSNEKYIDYFADEQVRGFIDDDFFERGRNLEKINEDTGEVIGVEKTYEKPEPTDQMAFVFMQILTADEDPIKTALDDGAAAGFVYAGAAIITPFAKVFTFVGWELQALAAVGIILGTAGFSYFKERGNQVLAAGYCGKFTGERELSHGCSLLTPTDYNDISQINDLCYILEGNP